MNHAVELWSKQYEVLDSVYNNKYTAVPAAHGVGKSRLAAELTRWWIESNPLGDGFVVIVAPTQIQINEISWKCLADLDNLPGRLVNKDTWIIQEMAVAKGISSRNITNDTFAGIHKRYVLFIIDEAAHVDEKIWDVAETLTTSDGSKIIALGCPDDPNSKFAQKCSDPNWNTVKISIFDSPNFTGEDVSEQIRRNLVDKTFVETAKTSWGENSPLYQAKLCGEFPWEV